MSAQQPITRPRWPIAAAAAALFILVVAIWIYALVATPVGAVGWAIGVIAIVGGAGCFAASIARTLRENSSRRIPFWGSGPVSPRRLDLIAGLGLPMLGGGALLVATLLDRGVWPALALIITAGVLGIAAQIIHNRLL